MKIAIGFIEKLRWGLPKSRSFLRFFGVAILFLSSKMYAQPWHPDADRELTEYEGEFIGPPDSVFFTTLIISGLLPIFFAFKEFRNTDFRITDITLGNALSIIVVGPILWGVICGLLMYPIWILYGLFSWILSGLF